MYTLLIKHPQTGYGCPLAFMLTNDHGHNPLVQWLEFLKNNASMDPVQVTINCCAAEVRSIRSIFPQALSMFCKLGEEI
jgi:hypothetical protein